MIKPEKMGGMSQIKARGITGNSNLPLAFYIASKCRLAFYQDGGFILSVGTLLAKVHPLVNFFQKQIGVEGFQDEIRYT